MRQSGVMTPPTEPEIVIDLDAIGHNVRVLRELAGVPLIAVVKADAYGHGLLPVASAAREAGAAWLATATPTEALALRAGGDTGPILCWLATPGAPYAEAIAAEIDLTAYSVAELDEIACAVAEAGRPARVQLKVDTGLNRGGAPLDHWTEVVTRALAGEHAGAWRVSGVWSHFACADEPRHPANHAQEEAFVEAVQLAEAAGLRPELRHLANSAATLLRPSARFDAVRCGIAVYGLDPAPGHTHADLRPAMTVRAPLALVKHVAAGDSVSYGHLWTAEHDTTLGLVPLGYADGVPRSASDRGGHQAEVSVAGTRVPVRGRICMDQFMVDLSGVEARDGDEVVIFGSPELGGVTAQDWAVAAGTINYEIVTRIGGRLRRTYSPPTGPSGGSRG